MKKGILIIHGIVILGLVGNSIYQQLNKKGAKSQILE
jgi:hypothetical protein